MKDNNKTQRSSLDNVNALQNKWPCDGKAIQVEGDPAKFFLIDLVTGTTSPLSTVSPAGKYNAIGYNPVDSTLWGYSLGTSQVVQFSYPDGVATGINVPNLPPDVFNVGDVDKNGYLYLYSTFPDPESKFFVVDVTVGRSTFGKLVDPRAGFTEQTTAPFGVPLSPLLIADWGFNPKDNQLYAVQNEEGQVYRINPITGEETPLTGVVVPKVSAPDGYGGCFFDNEGAFYVLRNLTGDVYRITISGDSATGTLFSRTTIADGSQNDGARCPTAPLDLLTLDPGKSVDLLTACSGDILTYTVQVKNPGTVLTATNSIFKDTIPTGTTFVPNSVKVNGVQTPGNPNDGVPIGDIAPQQSVTITFQVRVGDNPPNPIVNQASVSADNSATAVSNQVSTQVIQAILTVTKEADVGAVQCSGHITYTISITNEGPDNLNQIEVLDPIDPKTTFVPNSVTVDGVPQTGANPTTGITISSFPAHTTKVIQFQVQVVPNTSGWIYNKAQAISCGTNTFTSNQTRVKICPCNLM